MEKQDIKIYLAGDLHDDWREILIKYLHETYTDDSIKNIFWLNPKRIVGAKHDSNVAHECVTIDLKLIEESDFVIAYLSRKELYGTVTEILHSLSNNKIVYILLNTYESSDNKTLDYDKDDIGWNVVGSSYFNFPYISPYWFLIQYINEEYCNNVEESCNHKIFVYNNNPEVIESLFEKEIFKGVLKKNKEREKDVNLFLEDLIDEESGYEKTEVISRFKRDYSIIKSKKGKYKECQLCGFTFKKKNGENYNEIHHIIPLSKNGKDAEINTLVLCANCHRQLHYANVDLSGFVKGDIKINGTSKKISFDQ